MTIELENKDNETKQEVEDSSFDSKLSPSQTKLGEQDDSQMQPSLTAPSIHHTIIPINMANLPLNILEQLQQQENGIITSLSTLSYPPVIPAPQSEDTPRPGLAKTTKEDEAGGKMTTKSLTADERRQRRLLRNRLAAKDCSKKKKEYIKQMEETIARLEAEKVDLAAQVQVLQSKVDALPPQEDDNYKLMKEVEILNAKLGNIK